MDLNKIHFIREILVTELGGKRVPTMQISYANASFLDPAFLLVPFADDDEVRRYYQELGGSRRAESLRGSTVVIPNRSFWNSRWRIRADQVKVLPAVNE